MSCFYFWVSSDDIYAHFMVGVPVTVSTRGLDSPSRHPPPHRDIIYRLQHFIISWSHVHSINVKAATDWPKRIIEVMFLATTLLFTLLE